MSVHVMSTRKFQIEETEKLIPLLAELSCPFKRTTGSYFSRDIKKP